MYIDEKDLEEFIRLFEEEFGEKLSLDDARAMAQRVIFLCERLIDPLPEDENCK